MTVGSMNQPPAWTKWIGDMSIITDFLLKKPWLSPWCVPKTINSTLRAIGTVTFANNPITGLIILVGIFVGNTNIGLGCLLAGIIGVIFSKILKQSEVLINDGVTGFNGILVSCLVVNLYPSISGRDIDSIFWAYLTVTLIITTYVDKGLNALMDPASLPAFSIPFNLSAAVLLLTVRSTDSLGGQQMSLAPSTNQTLTEELSVTHDIDWNKVMEGTILAAGQIYGVGTLASSILILVGFLWYSPILVIFTYAGSVIGTLIGVLVSSAPYTDVYSGLWGYNGMLTTGAISFFLVPTPATILAAVAGAVMATTVQAAILSIFRPNSIPVLSYPFNIATVLITAISTAPDSPFRWVANRTYPEKHLLQYYRGQMSRTNS